MNPLSNHSFTSTSASVEKGGRAKGFPTDSNHSRASRGRDEAVFELKLREEAEHLGARKPEKNAVSAESSTSKEGSEKEAEPLDTELAGGSVVEEEAGTWNAMHIGMPFYFADRMSDPTRSEGTPLEVAVLEAAGASDQAVSAQSLPTVSEQPVSAQTAEAVAAVAAVAAVSEAGVSAQVAQSVSMVPEQPVSAQVAQSVSQVPEQAVAAVSEASVSERTVFSKPLGQELPESTHRSGPIVAGDRVAVAVRESVVAGANALREAGGAKVVSEAASTNFPSAAALQPEGAVEARSVTLPGREAAVAMAPSTLSAVQVQTVEAGMRAPVARDFDTESKAKGAPDRALPERSAPEAVSHIQVRRAGAAPVVAGPASMPAPLASATSPAVESLSPDSGKMAEPGLSRAEESSSSTMQSGSLTGKDLSQTQKGEGMRVFFSRIESAVQQLREERMSSVRLQFTLAEGQTVRIRMSLRGRQLSTVIQTDSEALRGAFREGWESLSRVLSERGVDAEEVEFSLDGEAEGRDSGRDPSEERDVRLAHTGASAIRRLVAGSEGSKESVESMQASKGPSGASFLRIA